MLSRSITLDFPARARAMRRMCVLTACAATLVMASARAQSSAAPASGPWTDCTTLSDNSARLACFDRWAARQTSASALAADAAPPALAPPAGTPIAEASTTDSARVTAIDDDLTERPCSDPQSSPLSRFWELEPASDCGTFGIRGYRPLSLSWIGSDSVNKAPSSPAAGHTVTTPVNYSTSETRIQLSVRTKIARGLLTEGDSPRRDSLWFGYTQQSYWQLFNGDISRPFRSTDHEPELTYIFPTDVPLQGGWRWRYAGLSLNHQSNGQSLPLSRSWNRIIAMVGVEKDDRFALTARAWARVPEKDEDDDNPDISDMIGRAELTGTWYVNKTNTLAMTLRHALRSSARGSVRLEWLRTIGSARANGEPSRLRFHTQLFSGYGDSLLDYNRKRTVLSLGLSLVDF
ncbi:phospholipase A [Comamonadaceae bacterium G21597-S1]|nr:phospholipase A [Comamonadaceae bacterium G21597-S1]